MKSLSKIVLKQSSDKNTTYIIVKKEIFNSLNDRDSTFLSINTIEYYGTQKTTS